jgi:hypothetical protein
MLEQIEFKWITNATFSLKFGSSRIMFDPWGSETASYGSWFHFPPLDDKLSKLIFEEKYDAIFISHHHTDHFDHRTLNRIMSANQQTKLYFSSGSSNILNHPIKVLKNRFGDNRVFVSTDAVPIIVENFKVTFYRSDFCDPQMCGSIIGCLSPNRRTSSIDSFITIDIDKTRIVNFNDSLIRLISPTINKVIDQADVVMGLFGGAGPYPQCFPDLRENKSYGKELVNRFIDDLIAVSNKLNAKYIFPFSGQYILGGKLSYLNEYRAMVPISKAHKKINQYFHGKRYSVDLNPGSIWLIPNDLRERVGNPDLPIVEQKSLEIPKNVMHEYTTTISQKILPYEKIELDKPKLVQLKELLSKSSDRYNKAVIESKVSELHTVLIEPIGLGYLWEINSKGHDSGVARALEFRPDGEWTLIKIDPRLLYVTVNRKEKFGGYTTAHWTNIHGGSHLEFFQNGYSAAALYFLNFFHA